MGGRVEKKHLDVNHRSLSVGYDDYEDQILLKPGYQLHAGSCWLGESGIESVKHRQLSVGYND